MRPSLSLLPLAAALVFCPTSTAQTTQLGLNEKNFCTGFEKRSLIAWLGRMQTSAETSYFSLPQIFNSSYGTGTGWRVLLRDTVRSTTELVGFAFVKQTPWTGAAPRMRPDISSAGILAAVKPTAVKFPGTGTIATARVTMTLPKGVVLPRDHALRINLPAWRGSDKVWMGFVEGCKIVLPGTIKKTQWTWYVSGGVLMPWGYQIRQVCPSPLPLTTEGTTFDLGALYNEPVLQMYHQTTAYGGTDDVFGPGSLYPSPASSGMLGFTVNADRFKKGVAAVIYSSIKIPLAKGVPTQFGTLYVPLALTFGGFPLSQRGSGTTPLTFDFKSPALPFPAKFSGYGQMICIAPGATQPVVALSSMQGWQGQ